MQIGLLWYDDDPKKPLDIKIEQATTRFREKYGYVPNACYVNPGALPAGKGSKVRVVGARTVRPNYFWVGVDES
jgi:hypothetical protein